MDKQPRALIVDDAPVWRDKLANILEKEGYLTEQASSREEAGHLLIIHIFDVVIVDVNLTDAPTDDKGEPLDKQGMELIAAIRQFAQKKELAVIIVTGYGTRSITRDAFKHLGVSDVFFKQDFNVKEFRETVKAATASIYLKRAGEEDESVLGTA